MTKRRYDVLLCDADETLFDFKQAEANAFAAACACAGTAATPALLTRYSQINNALWKQLEKGAVTQRELRVRRFEQFLEQADIKADAEAVARSYEHALSHQAILLPGAAEAVARWRKILPVMLVTNGICAIQRGRIARSAIATLIAGVVVSEEVGAAKPNPQMLHIAMARAGVTDPSRALMLGDSLSSDIQGAANAGIDACWYNPHSVPVAPDLTIRFEVRSLCEVDDILLPNGEEAEK